MKILYRTAKHSGDIKVLEHVLACQLVKQTERPALWLVIGLKNGIESLKAKHSENVQNNAFQELLIPF